MIKLIAGGPGVARRGAGLHWEDCQIPNHLFLPMKVHFVDKGSCKEETCRLLLSQIVNI